MKSNRCSSDVGTVVHIQDDGRAKVQFPGLSHPWTGHVESLVLRPPSTAELAIAAAPVMSGAGHVQLAKVVLHSDEWCKPLQTMLKTEACCGDTMIALASACREGNAPYPYMLI